MPAILAFLLILLVLILAHEAGHALAARASGCRVEEFGFGLPPRVLGKQIGETLFSLNALPIGGFVRITGEDQTESVDQRSFAARPRSRRALILVAGVLANLLLAVVLFTSIAGIGMDVALDADGNAAEFPSTAALNRRVEIVEVKDRPALRNTDLTAGDVLRRVGNTEVLNTERAVELVRGFAGSELTLTVERQHRPRSLTIYFDPAKSSGESIGLGLVDVGTIRVPWWRAPFTGLRMTGRTVVLTWTGIGQTIREAVIERKRPEDLAGPVGIASLTGVVAQRGPVALLEFTAVLSANLALVNLLPFPALDGGRLLFLFLDALGLRFLRGRPERLAHTIGFAVLLILLALITVGDIQRLGR